MMNTTSQDDSEVNCSTEAVATIQAWPAWPVPRRIWILPYASTADVSLAVVVIGIMINGCGVVGNVAVVGAIIISKRLRKAYNVCIGSLAVNDLLGFAFSHLFQMIAFSKKTWPFSYELCVFHYFAFQQFNMSTVLHILAITTYRYVVVVHPAMGRRVSTKTFVSVLVCVLHALPTFMITLPKAGHMDKFIFFGKMALCLPGPGTPNQVPPLYLFIFFDSLVLITLLLSHLRIHHSIKKTEARLAAPQNATARHKKHAKVLKCMLVIFVLFSVSYFPLVGIIVTVRLEVKDHVLMIANCLLWLSSGTNWIVYGALDKEFREAYKKLFFWWRSKVGPVQSNTVTLTASENKENNSMQTLSTRQTVMSAAHS